MFDQQNIAGDFPKNKAHIIYYSCDPTYWAEHGQYLAKSTSTKQKKSDSCTRSYDLRT